MPAGYIMEAKTFLEFVYPEVKDLCKHFLTLASGILVFSVTFSEKIVNFQTAGKWARFLLLTAWVLFAAAIAGGGTSLTALFVAAGRARAGEDNWGNLMVAGGYRLFAAGGAFCLGLLALALSGAVTVLTRKPADKAMRTPNEQIKEENQAVTPNNVL